MTLGRGAESVDVNVVYINIDVSAPLFSQLSTRHRDPYEFTIVEKQRVLSDNPSRCRLNMMYTSNEKDLGLRDGLQRRVKFNMLVTVKFPATPVSR